MMDSGAELMLRHSVTAPRYTSYPAVPFWDGTPSADDWLAALATALDGPDAGNGIALYVHVPFCAALCTFCGCNMRVARGQGLTAPYVDALLAEAALYRDALGANRLRIGQLYLGGGTPTFLRAADLDRLLDGLLSLLGRTDETEFTIEADPRNTTREQLDVLARHGFSVLSLGVQDLDARVLEIVSRPQTEAQVRGVVDAARGAGFRTVSFDLMQGLPLQTPESIRETMEAVARMRPDRIIGYPYVPVPWIKPSQRQFTDADLPEREARVVLQSRTHERLLALGYEEVGLDTYALPDDALAVAARRGNLHRNFMGYSPVRAHPLVALGTSAIGDAGTAYAQNDKNLQQYQERVQRGELPLQRGHRLSEEDLVLRRHILNLLTRRQTEWREPADMTPFLDGVAARLAPLAADGLVVPGEREVTVTTEGLRFLRNICLAFDARLHRARAAASAAA